MFRLIFGVFIVLHGLVHFLYFGQSWRLFELQPGMVWPEGSWVFSKLVGNEAIKLVASAFCILAAIGFAAGGTAILLKQGWWRPVIAGAAVFSTVVYILFWNGKIQRLHDQGGIGLLINIAIVVAVFILHWPDFDL